jgi:hypothetical protein
MWETFTAAFDLEEGEERYLSMSAGPHPRDGRFKDPFVVLVEQLEGEAGAFEVDVQGIGTQVSERPEVNFFFGSLRSTADAVVHLVARWKGRFRVTIARLRKHLSKNSKKFPCDACKAIAKILNRGGLASAGLPNPLDWGELVDAASSVDVPKLVDIFLNSPLGSWAKQSGLEVMVLPLIGILGLALRSAGASEDWVYDQLCRLIGACP